MIYYPIVNLLLVHNTPTNLKKLEKNLERLDVTPKQVSIEAKFLTIAVNDLDKVGFTWDLTLSDLNNRTREVDGLVANTTLNDGSPARLVDIDGDGTAETIPFFSRADGTSVIRNTITEGVISAVASPGPVGSFTFTGSIENGSDGDRLGVMFDFLDSLEESELLSSPRVTTMNQKPAVIVDITTEFFVSNVFKQLITSEANLGGSSSIGFTETIIPTQFIFGITLSVTPQISGTDRVRLWLNPQITSRLGEKQFNSKSNINGVNIDSIISLPTISTQAVWTNVIVHDGDTLVLGGLVTDRTIKGQEKLPYIANIPIIGWFFRGKSREVRQSSLLIFVTPDIIDTTGSRSYEAGF